MPGVVVQLPRFSPLIFVELSLTFGVSLWVFIVLTRRWVEHRPTAALRDWAYLRRFKIRFAPKAQLPEALANLKALSPETHVVMTSRQTQVVRVSTAPPPAGKTPVWHLVLLRTQSAWPPTALRPVGHSRSFLDLFTLPDLPKLLSPERFTVHGVDEAVARKLVQSSARGLLPPDVGLLLHGPFVTIDFSNRPFDTVEFDRMLAVLGNLVPALSVVTIA